MGKSYKPSQIASTRSSRNKKRQFATVGDITIDKQTKPASYNLLLGLQKQGIPFDNGMTWNGAAKELMGALDCGIVNMSMSYSLTDDDTETLDNENIMDEDLYGSLKPEPISTNESFTDPNDPFYQMGDDLPDDILAEQQQTKTKNENSYITFAARLFNQSKQRMDEEEVLKLFRGTSD